MPRRAFAANAALLVALFACVSPALADYKIVQRIKVPDGGFDYATFDASTGRVLMARTDFTTVIDAKTGKVSQLDSAARAHMTLPVPGTTLAALPQREGNVRIVDMATDKVLADIPAQKNPDGAVYDPFSKLVFAMNHDSGEASGQSQWRPNGPVMTLRLACPTVMKPGVTSGRGAL